MTETRVVDVAVIGAGPAGLAAATEAAMAGARVLVVDQSSHTGGQIWRRRDDASLAPGARRTIGRFEASGAAHLARATVVDAEAGRLALVTPDGPLLVRANAIVLATGARELFLPFPGWTLPNVFGVGGLQALIKSGLDVRHKRILIAGTGPLLFPVAATAAAQGAEVVAVAEQAARGRVLSFGASLWSSPSKIVAAAAYRATFRRSPFHTGTWIVRAEGQERVRRAVLTDGRRRWNVECDLIAAACGLIPNVEVGIAMGCVTHRGALVVDDRQQCTIPGVFAAGECTGVGGEDLALVEGTIAGLAAVGRPASAWYSRRSRLRAFAGRMAVAFALRPELLARADAQTVVCRCEDVRMAALDGDWSGGGRQAKLASRAGMGACQGRVCGAALQRLFGWEAPVVRPPLSPVTAASFRELEAPD